jgi:hypothetical protein
LAALSCWRTAVSFNAASARLLSADSNRLIAGDDAGETPQAPPSGSPPQGQDLTLALYVSKMEGRLPRCPHACAGGQAFPIINLPQKILGRKDGRQSHHHKFDVGDGHARPLCLFLSILQHVDVLGNAIRLDVILMHFGAEGNHVNGMKSPAVGVLEGDNFKGQNLSVEGVGVLEVFEPDLIDGFSEEFGRPTLRCLRAGVVVKAGFVGASAQKQMTVVASSAMLPS